MNGRIFLTLLIAFITSICGNAGNFLNLESETFENVGLDVQANKQINETGDGYDVTSVTSIKTLNKKRERIALVSEDKIWHYYTPVNTSMTPSTDIYVNLRFYGETEIDGNVYKNCYVYKAGNEFNENNRALIAYMRQENGKVYARYIPEIINDCLVDENPVLNKYGIDPMGICVATIDDIENVQERLIYDFDLQEDDYLYFNRQLLGDVGMKVESVSDVISCGYSYKLQKYYNEEYADRYNVYDNIGTQLGFLPFPGPFVITSAQIPYELISVTDLDGVELFDLKDISGIDFTEDDTEQPVDVKYFGIDGLQVDSPDGGLFIKVSRYRNGNVSTEKIFKR